MTQTAPILDAALAYAQRYGWAVHPVNINKKPTTDHGFYDATTDEATIREYFKNGAQISVRTGATSGVFVLDIDEDPEKGFSVDASLAMIMDRYGPLPHTPHQRTGRGGVQYFFKYQDGLRNKAGSLLGPGIDTRGEGGYAVVAPSRNTKGKYEWIVSPADAPLADVPQWLIDLMTTKPERNTRNRIEPAQRNLDPYIDRAFRDEIANVATAPDGQKHETLRNSAIKLGSLSAHGLDEQLIVDGLYNAIAGRARDPENARRTIQDGIDYGKQRPREIPERTRDQPRDQHEGAPHPADVPAAAYSRLTIDISTLDLPTVMPQAWHAIITANDPPTLFRRAGELARLESTESGALIVKTIDTRVMTGILARAARWVRVSYDRKGNATEKETLPPAAVVDDCMVNSDSRIPPITRVVHAPTFAAGATLLTAPGYHPEARIYYDPKAGAVVPDVPEEPTTGDLKRARDLVLGELLINFPFVSDADQAHAVALFLLPFVRDLIAGPTPLHLIEAPTMGSGKGLLADALLLPSLGDVPSPMAEATTDEEWRKRITSALLGAPAVIYIDNLNRMLAAGALAAALTTTEYSDRVLGKSEQVSLPVRCVWVATANNPTLSTEISRRCIRIRIDPRVDKPWQREGFKHPKLRTWIADHRGDVIWAALVICRYGLQHGAVGRPLGSYESWSDVLGRILDGCGFEGFLGNLDALYDRADVEGTAWRALIAAWWEKHQSTEQLASDLFPLVAEVDADVLISGKDETGRKRSFGKALARARDRVFSIDTGGATTRLQVAAGGVLHKAQRWTLAPVEGGGFGYFGGFSPSGVRTNNFSSTELKENPHNTHNTHPTPACPGVVVEDLPADLSQAQNALVCN